MKLPYFKWYPTDFWGDACVLAMSPTARLAYRGLLDVAWQIGPLTDPETALQNLGADPALWREISAAWTETPDGWVQKRLEEERQIALQRREKAEKAALARWNAQSNAKAMPLASNANHSHSHSHNHTKNPPTPRRGKGVELVELLKSYPHLDTPEVMKALAEWVAFRRESHFVAWKLASWKKNLTAWGDWTPEELIQAIDKSIASGWRSINHPGPRQGGAAAASKAAPKSYSEQYPEDQ